MLAVSTMTAVLYSLKTLLVQLDRESQPLTRALEGGKNKNVLNEEFSYYNKKGLDEVLEKSKLRRIGKSVIQDNTVNIKHTNLYYMPPSKKTGYELEQMMNGDCIASLLNGMYSFNSLNFIDCMNGSSELTKILLEQTDILVINLFQGMEDMDDILECQEIREKALFVVGKYDGNSRENLQNIRRKYNIAKDAIGVIPYNIHFHDAMMDGKLVSFITKGIFSKKTDPDYEFIIELFHTTNMILRKAGYEGI